MNEVLFFVTMLVTLSGVILFYKLFGKTGMCCWIAFASIIANIETIKLVDMFGKVVTLGTILYSCNYLCTDILHEKYGGEESRKAIKIGFIALIAFIILEQLTLLFKPSAEDFADSSLHMIFGFMPRLCVASLISYYVTNMLDTYLYGFISKHTEKIWLRNNGSTMVSQCVDTILFTTLAFAGSLPFGAILELMLTTYIIKWVVALFDTPFIYWAKKITPNNERAEPNS